jgi:hypothetical protein
MKKIKIQKDLEDKIIIKKFFFFFNFFFNFFYFLIFFFFFPCIFDVDVGYWHIATSMINWRRHSKN